MSLARRRYLTRIVEARPIPAGTGIIEVHMLLNHKRIYEGLWALYSFVYFCVKPCRIVIHDDGTLVDSDTAALNRVFPQCKIVSRRDADSVVLSYFRSEGLSRCMKLRESYIFSLKFFDPFFFLSSSYFILFDSDVLFFACPHELIDGLEANKDNTLLPNLYTVDVNYIYPLEPNELKILLGRDCIERANAGLLRIRKGTLDFRRIERYLQHPKFRMEGRVFHNFTESALWAMELTLSGAFPLPATYAVGLTVKEPELVSRHFCGVGYNRLFYSRGLARLASTLLGK